jgi:hypothetical protein
LCFGFGTIFTNFAIFGYSKRGPTTKYTYTY